MTNLETIILAAGKGTRMKSDLPKVLHPIGGRALLSHVLMAAQALEQESHFHIIVGYGAQQIKDSFTKQTGINFVEQAQQLGTGHAVQQVLPQLKEESISLILYGDVPLIQPETLKQLVDKVDDSTLGLLTVNLKDPTGYGRIVRDSNDSVTSIIEQKDASTEQLKIEEINTGIMAVNTRQLRQWLPQLRNDNAQGEYYLTDIISIAATEGIHVITHQPNEEWEVMGINNRLQQAELERIYQFNYAQTLMDTGVSLLDPQRFDCRGQLSCGADVVIDINCVFEGKNIIGNNVVVGSNCLIKNSTIGDNTLIHANSIIENSIVKSNCNVGPFARLRPGSQLAEGAKVGNFVETKKASIGKGSKVNHLSYVGDAVLGNNVNIGAGTITCNYDGVNKLQTTIGDDVFIGSNTSLVAPITIEGGATVGAGSTINKKVKQDTLALARSPQKTIPGWQKPTKRN